MRKLIAIGDLHGDFYRLTRILAEENVLDPVTLRWTEKAENADVILLGDYVDWRGERLEGPPEEWPSGARRVVELILSLSEQKESSEKKSKGRFSPLLGNHDAMMLESHEILESFLEKEEGGVEQVGSLENWIRFLSSKNLTLEEENGLLRFLNWFEQGGERTIRSFGGSSDWLLAMRGKIGNFLKNLPFAVIINQKLFCHSLPDAKEYWIPLSDHKNQSEEDYARIREQYLWGRKVWGLDAFAGGKTNPFSEEEIDEMLSKLKVKAAVVGHTPLHKGAPYFHFGGKIVNLDTHGIPGSPPFVEEYEPQLRERKMRPKKRHPMKKHQKQETDGKR